MLKRRVELDERALAQNAVRRQSVPTLEGTDSVDHGAVVGIAVRQRGVWRQIAEKAQPRRQSAHARVLSSGLDLVGTWRQRRQGG